jgi:hypothetical protein
MMITIIWENLGTLGGAAWAAFDARGRPNPQAAAKMNNIFAAECLARKSLFMTFS